MFIDETNIKVIAGSGGDGCTAFRREKYVEMGGPFGGNGGKGSDIIFKVDTGLHTLVDLRYMKTVKGKKGENGSGKNMDGKSADDIIIKVPQGTVVSDFDTGLIIADLKEKDDMVVVAKGGRGGRGNTAFKTLANPAPNFSENGEPGEERILKVELKLLADVGLVGLPSVGKSTFLSKVSKATPKIADYHFTTLSPNLGVVKTIDNRSFVMADLPGLIEGASQGVGLGDKFLRHIERTKVIAHIVDMSGLEGRDPFDDYQVINKELENFSPKLLKKPMVVIANKMDMPEAKKNLEEFKKKVNVEVYPISAITSSNLNEVLIKLADLVDKEPNTPLYDEETYLSHVLYKFEEEKPFTIEKENDTYIIRGKNVEKMFRMTNFQSDEGIERFIRQLRKLGIDEELEKMGIEEGSIVKILDYEFEYRK
ncbi:MAG: GTPase ObgE [Erysipelotrichaceae bacterium]|nr:GTPase ObgE [Erysipelotrichaceae bacterium]